MTHPAAAGERFLCTSGFIWMEEIATLLRQHLPERARDIPRRRLPNWVMRGAALFDPVIRSVIFELGVRRDCDATKARTVLGFSPRSERDAVIATADSLIAHGLV